MTDSGDRKPGGRPPYLKLPELLNVSLFRVPFEPRRLRHVQSAFVEVREAIELRVETDEAISMTEDVTPVLYVGDTMVTELRDLGKNVYSFLAIEEHRLQAGAPIVLAYPNTPRNLRRESAHYYEEPNGADSATQTDV